MDDFSNGSSDKISYKAGQLAMYTMSLLNLKASKTMQLGLTQG